MSLSGTSANRHAESALRAQLESMRPGSLDTSIELAAGDIKSNAQALQLLQQHSLHLAGSAPQPKTALTDILVALDTDQLNRRSLDILVGILGKTQDTESKTQIVNKLKEAFETDTRLTPPNIGQHSVIALLDYISEGDETKGAKVKEFANLQRDTKLESFSKQVQSNSALRGILNIAKSKGLETELKSLEKEFTERFQTGSIDSFSDYDDLRETLANRIINSNKAFAIRGQVALNGTEKFNTVTATAVEMNIITAGKTILGKSFSLNDIMFEILGAKDQDAVRLAVSDFHTMISVLEKRWVQGTDPQRQEAAKQMETLYAIIKNKSIMGNLLGVFQKALIDNADVLAEIPNELNFAMTNNQEHLYTGLTKRLSQLGITGTPTTLGAFMQDLNQARVDLSQNSQATSEVLISKLFRQKTPSKADIAETAVAKEILTAVDEDSYNINLLAKAEANKKEIIQTILDQFEVTGGKVDFANAYNQQIANIYFGSSLTSGQSTKDHIRAYMESNFDKSILTNSKKEDNLRVLATTYEKLQQIQANPDEYTQYLKGFIEKTLVNPRSLTGLKSIVSKLQSDGAISSSEETRLNKALDAYTQNPSQAANAFEDIANHFLTHPGNTFNLFYVEVYEALGVRNTPQDNTFHSNNDYILESISSSVEQLREDIVSSDLESAPERILYDILYADEIDAKSWSAGDKHPAQGKEGLLNLLMSGKRLGSEDITSGTPKLVALADLICRTIHKLNSGEISNAEYNETMQYIEERMGLKMKHPATILADEATSSHLFTSVSSYIDPLINFAHRSVELGKLNVSLDTGADGALPRRLEKALGKEFFTGEEMQAQVTAAEDFASALTSGQNPYDWLRENGSSHKAITRLALRVVGDDTTNNYATVKGLETRREISSENISTIIELIQNFVKYFTRAKMS